MSSPWENYRNKNHEEMRYFPSPTLPSNEIAFQDLWQCLKIFVLLQSLPRDRAIHIYIKLSGAERDSLWNLHTGRKWPIHLKIMLVSVRECEKFATMVLRKKTLGDSSE